MAAPKTAALPLGDTLKAKALIKKYLHISICMTYTYYTYVRDYLSILHIINQVFVT